MRGRGYSVGLLVLFAASVVLSAQNKNFEAEKNRLGQEAVKARAALGLELLDPKLDKLYPYSQIPPVKVQKLAPGTSTAVALTGKFPPNVAVLSERDGAVLSGAAVSATSYSARITIGATEGPGFVKLWAITPVHFVWTTVPVVFIDVVYRFDLKSPNGYTVKATPLAKSFTVDDRPEGRSFNTATLPYKVEFFKPGETAPFETREGSMRYMSDQDRGSRLDIEMPEPEKGAAKELDELMKKMSDPKLTDAQRNDLTVKMIQAQQRMMEELTKADPAADQKRKDQFGCNMIQVYPGAAGAVEGGVACGKNIAPTGSLRVTGTVTQVK